MKNPKRMQASKLNDLVNPLINTLLPKAYSNKSFFVNDIPGHLMLKKASPAITFVLGGLLSAVVSNAKDSCIRLSAKLHGNVILVNVRNANGFNPHAIHEQLWQLRTLAEKSRCTISFTIHERIITSLTFGFHP